MCTCTGSTVSRTTHSTSKRDIIGSVRSTFSAKVSEGSYLPPKKKYEHTAMTEGNTQWTKLTNSCCIFLYIPHYFFDKVFYGKTSNKIDSFYKDFKLRCVTNRISCSNDSASGLEWGDNASFGDGDTLLLHGLMDTRPVCIIHLEDRKQERKTYNRRCVFIYTKTVQIEIAIEKYQGLIGSLMSWATEFSSQATETPYQPAQRGMSNNEINVFPLFTLFTFIT